MKKNYREPLQQYLERHNINQSEFADWAGVPLWAVRTESKKYARKIFAHMLQRHPLTTPAVPEDVYQRICSFRDSRKLQWADLEKRWGIIDSTLQMWRTVRPSPPHWRQFCAQGGYADIMQDYTNPPNPEPQNESLPSLRGEQRFVLQGRNVFHPRHGWGVIIAVVDQWATVRCRDGIERYYLLQPAQIKKLND